MASPFPGMDPYLEGYLWPDVHHELASSIKELIAPQILPKYIARINLYTVADTSPEEDIGIMYPDVEVLKKSKSPAQPAIVPPTKNALVATPSTLTIQTEEILEVRIPVIEIRDREQNQLITAIEILSPVNKRKPGLEPYRKKRRRLHNAGVHLLEIDLLRRGERPFAHPFLPKAHYLVTLTRAGTDKTDVWVIDITDKLPVLPIPLAAGDEDALLDLRKAMDIVYDRSFYQLSIDYQAPTPPPEFSDTEKSWIRQLLANK